MYIIYFGCQWKYLFSFAFAMIDILTSRYWEDYKLLDSGNKLKLEQFGKYILIRPEPQALWRPEKSIEQWRKIANAEYKATGNYSGKWIKYKPTPNRWIMKYRSPEVKLRFYVELRQFKNIGVFPEQAVNWDYIMTRARQIENCKVLNLFAYTGLASITARVAKAEVTHVDALKSSMNVARENMLLNNVGHIRWIHDDVRKFVKREIRRKNKYNGVILDPPAFGHGPKKEKWVLEDHLAELIDDISKIMYRKNFFLVVNTYSLNMSALTLGNIISDSFGNFTIKKMEIGETFLPEEYGRKLSTGVVVRIYG